MEKKITTNVFFYMMIFLIVTVITDNIVASTHTYDPGLVAMLSFLFIGIPFIIGGSIVMIILLKKKVKFRTQIISAVIIVILIVLAFLPLVHRNGLPGDDWEYNQELTELYMLSLGDLGEHEQYGVYLGKATTQGREAALYKYEPGWDSWTFIKTGIEKDGKLFINNWRVYPTEFVGKSDQELATGRVYINGLNLIYGLYSVNNKVYLRNESGGILFNLSEYGLNVGDYIAVYGENVYDHSDDTNYVVVDSMEKVETL